MYEKLVGKQVKIVHEDGDRIIVTNGIIQAYDDSIKTIQIFSEYTKKDSYINAKTIQKLEVLD